MTEREMLTWDLAENAIADALAEATALLAQVPEDRKHQWSVNCIGMAINSLDAAKSQLAAARARMPKEE